MLKRKVFICCLYSRVKEIKLGQQGYMKASSFETRLHSPK
nr:hypothetical protein [Escherichia coli]